MFLLLKPSDGSKDAYGLGWGNENEGGIASVGHNGGLQSTSTAFTIAPTQKAGVVVLTNMEGADASDLAQEILKVLPETTETRRRNLEVMGLGDNVIERASSLRKTVDALHPLLQLHAPC